MDVAALPVPCPACGSPLVTGAPRCQDCDLPLTGPLAARLWHVDQQLAALQVERAGLLTALRSPAAAEPPPAARRWSWSGQQVLLGLGVLVLLTAVVVFLAVTWDRLGVAGQVGVAAVVAAAAALGARTAVRAGLTSTAEAVSVLACGFVAADLVAARRLGLAALDDVDALSWSAVTAAVLAGFAAGAALLDRRLRVFPVVAVGASGVAVVLALAARDAGPATSAVLLLAAGAVQLGAAWALRRVHPLAGRAATAGGAVLSGLAAGAGLVSAAEGGAASVAGSAVVLVVALGLGLLALRGRLPVATGPTGALLTGGVVVSHLDRVGTAALLTACLVGAAVHSAVVLARADRGTPAPGPALPATGAALLSGAAAGTVGLTLVAVLDHAGPGARGTALLGVAAALAVNAARRAELRLVLAGLAALAAVSAVDHATSQSTAGLRSGALLAAGLLVLLLAAWRRPRLEERTLAGVAAFAALLALGAAADSGQARTSAVVLGGAGLAAFVYALLPRRGPVALVGVAGTTGAQWVLLADADVRTVEAYTLPLAALLLLVGLEHLRRRPGAPSWSTVGPASAVALLPSAVVGADDDSFLRAGLVLVAAAAVVAAGVRLGWVGPTASGAVAVLVVLVGQLGPVLAGLPRWITLGSVGLALLALGVRYEQRREDLGRARDWVGGLR